ncbi:EpsG family protein [Maribrevibacterium harenarium]|uniref:EpsG family protein n=1 Tax=Maribrevibacterium harenarium TaxID=2589817 RepID=A0A501X172_9GAMM|nr:EpsG family protein [Maribrevibacterium harenarium]TPE54291.1 EpsG family protein [Maribrevibacterium harenarium]
MIFFNLPVFFVCLSFFADFFKSSKLVISLLIFLATTLVAGTRYYADVDYGPYVDLFNETPSISDLSLTDVFVLYGEPGYLLFTSLIKATGFEFVAVTVLFSIFSVGIKVYVCSRLVSNYVFAFSLFLCLHFITVEFIELRWALSSAFVMLAVYFELKNKRNHFYFFIIFASFFQYFSLIFLIVVFFRFFSFRAGVLFFLVSIVIALSYKVLSPSISYSVDSDIYIVKRLFRYLNDPDSSIGLFSYLRVLMYFTIVVLILCFKESFSEFDVVLAMYSSLLVSISLIISFVPLLYYRSMVVSDFFMLVTMTLFFYRFGVFIRLFCMLFVVFLFSTWNILDMKNYEAEGYIFEYSSWLGYLI